VLGHPALRAIAGCTATSNYFSPRCCRPCCSCTLVRRLHWSAGLIGVMFMIANVGFPRGRAGGRAGCSVRLRLGRTIWVSILVSAIGTAVIGFSPRTHAFPFIVGGFVLASFGGPIYNIAQVT